MRLVVDASVAIKWVLNEAGSPEALALIHEDLIAPRFLLIECANVLWKAVRRSEISADEAERKLRDLHAGSVKLQDDPAAPALRLATALDRSVYDCLYLATAREHGVRMVTADGTFVRKLRAAGYTDALLLGESYA